MPNARERHERGTTRPTQAARLGYTVRHHRQVRFSGSPCPVRGERTQARCESGSQPSRCLGTTTPDVATQRSALCLREHSGSERTNEPNEYAR